MMLLVLGLGRTMAALSTTASDQEFVEDALQVLRAATLHRIDGKTVIGVAGDRAVGIVNLVRSNASRFVSNTLVRTVDIPRTGDASAALGELSVIIVLNATSAELEKLDAYASAKDVLTISRRPQDIGKVTVVVLHRELYVYGSRLQLEDVRLDDETMKRAKPAKAGSYKDAYNAAWEARGGTPRRPTPDWIAVVKHLRTAITARAADDGLAVVGEATKNVPYLPHLYLSEALARIGDCEGAKEERESYARGPTAVKHQERIKTISKVVDECPAGTGANPTS